MRRFTELAFGIALSMSLISGTSGCFPSLPSEEDDVAQTPDATTTDGVLSEPDVTGADTSAEIADDVANDMAVPPDQGSQEDVATDIVSADADADPGADIGPDIADDGSTPPDVAEDVGVDTETPVINACGGTGTLDGPPLDEPCGPCGDGKGECDAGDALKNKTFCVGASDLNLCGGCSVVNGTIGDACNDCGTLACDPQGSGELKCVEPAGGCMTWVVCGELNCEGSGRVCVPSMDADAFCGACLSGFVDIGGACLRTTTTPTNVTASIDRDAMVEIRWDVQPFATGYRVYRCALANCTTSDWVLVPNGDVAVPRYDDFNTDPAPQPGAPTALASDDSATVVTVTWQAVAAPTARAYKYRVASVGSAGETEPSSVVTGSRAPRAIDGYEVKVNTGTWQRVESGTTWTHTSAEAPYVVPGTATASQGVHATHVALAVSGVATFPGKDTTYRVRAVTTTGVGAESAAVIGRRVAPASWTVAWERSAGASANDFTLIPNATGNTWSDTDAPADGSVRFYRAVVTAVGAPTAWTAAVSGSRLPPPGVPGNVSATTDFEDRVEVTWTSVQGALGYHVYRNGTKLTTGNGVSVTGYTDMAAPAPTTNWAAPTAISATTTNSTTVTVTWTTPTRPGGANAVYAIAAVNSAGEGAKSASATGRRARPALTSFEVETTFNQATTWNDTSSTTTSWVHAAAPAGSLAGTFTATDGDHRAHVRLAVVSVSGTPTPVSYRVRGKLQNNTYTPISTATTGSRAIGTIARQWQRSSTTDPDSSTYNNISGATGQTHNDTDAPSDGSQRYYRLRVSAPGAASADLNPVLGRRLAIVQVSAGAALSGAHTCGLAVGGRVWCWGAQEHGRLGNGEVGQANVLTPYRIPDLFNITAISAGGAHSCALRIIGTTREVWCWGQNSSGQLGRGDTVDSGVPVKITSISNAASVSAGSTWSCATLTDGKARCWGDNNGYQLGDGTTTQRLTPQTVRISSTTDLTGVSKVVASSTVFGFHTCVTRTTGTGSCWGNYENENFGYLGIGTADWTGYPMLISGNHAFSSIAIGVWHTCGLAGNNLYCWGWNENGQLGLGDTNNRFVPTAVTLSSFAPVEVVAGIDFTCVRSNQKNVRCWGKGTSSPPTSNMSGLSSVDSMAAAGSHACATIAGTVKCWGSNGHGQLGNGSTTNSDTPVNVSLP